MFLCLDRKRWVILFDVLAKIAQEPVSIQEVYDYVQREAERLDLHLSMEELREIMRDLEARGIVKITRVDDTEKVVLTDTAKYFLQIYGTAWIGL